MLIIKFAKILLAAIVLISSNSHVVAEVLVEVSVPDVTIPESADFATLTLRDPWDMTEFSDISQYLNESGQREIIKNPRVDDGLFLGTAAGSISEGNNGNFYPLFPGYETAMLIGKVGHRYPIDAQQYNCLYLAMKVNTPLDASSPDRFRIFWFADERLNTAGSGFYGSTFPIRLFEPDAAPPAGKTIWKLHQVDLSNPPEGYAPGTATWNDRTSWQGLRVDPTSYANTDFAVDWVRLTKCQANFETITWSPNSSITTLWLRPAGTSRYIRVATDLVGGSGSYQLDVQGIAPGKYFVGLSSSLSDCCVVESKQVIEINQTPIAEFASPNFYSGSDYASTAGNAWDFQDPEDVVKVGGTQSQLVNGVLDLVTQSGKNADPKVFLNTPQLIPRAPDYRYFNFRMYTGGAWQNVPGGMILRWIWVQLNNQGDECFRVSHDIPLDVGWQIYSIDLHDPFNGIAEEVAGSCNGLGWHWLESSPLSRFRLDPNENILGVPLHQQLDWVRLTQNEKVAQGSPFLVRIGLNKLPGEIISTQFFYTNDPGNPTQHQAQEYPLQSTHTSKIAAQTQEGQPLNAEMASTVVIPLTVKNHVPSDLPGLAHEIQYNWDTSSVASGEYWVCVKVTDRHNEAIYCSETNVVVNPK
jgi:hypothetical protein